jgi:glycogen phosphorylase
MRVRQLLVLPSLPEKIKPLQEMANNLWYSWNWELVDLFIRLDPDLWEETAQNPIEMLSRLPQQRLIKASEDDSFLASLNKTYRRYRHYLTQKRWFHHKYPEFVDGTVAYFSLEYGMDTGLPVYSGGLGVLSGDTLKSGSDLSMPMVAIGLLYRYGYFRQHLATDGWQQERYEENDWYHMPVELVRDSAGEPIRVGIVLDGVPVQIQIWKVSVGVIPLYLLDTNIPENSSKAREITDVLYGGDKDMRIRQEIVLGIGGVKALKALGISPDIFHCNEGHSWFLTLERMRQLMQESHLTFPEAAQFVWSTTVFTTHTPVPAGNEKFDPVLVQRYLGDAVRQLGISWQDFLAVGRINPSDESEQFGMTVAALKFAAFCNGVSELHGKTSRQMWHNIWPNLPVEEVPIRAVTNGVHPASWISHDMKELYESYFGERFVERPGAQEIWEKVNRIPNIELWRVHGKRRERLVFFARKHYKTQLLRGGAAQVDIQTAEQILDPNVLTIGFARRFSTYKRGSLLFYDLARLEKIVNSEKHPVQIILAGKAHPLDNPGKEIIKTIVGYAADKRFRNRIIFLEDYDINIARYLVQGADIWLNNPRRPEEASGTSGMKAAINGALNVSILDGWWDEGYNEETGFKIGNGEELGNASVQDAMDAESLYSVLEREVVPLFYQRNEIDIPERWVYKMKKSIQMAGEKFAAQRMLMDYANIFYVPAMRASRKLRADDFAVNKQVAAWIDRVSASWDSIAITDIELGETEALVHVGQTIPVKMKVRLGTLSPEDVQVEVVTGRLNSREEIQTPSSASTSLNGSRPAEGSTDGTYTYHGEIICSESGRFGITARVIPKNDNLLHTKRPKLISYWQ